MATVVRPHKAPAARPIRSPVAPPPPKPSRRANTTAANAQAMPSHCTGRSRSVRMNKGSRAATQKGDVYKNTVSREAVVCCRPM